MMVYEHRWFETHCNERMMGRRGWWIRRGYDGNIDDFVYFYVDDCRINKKTITLISCLFFNASTVG